MLRERDRNTAVKFGILPLVETLRDRLLALDGVEDVEFDLDGFWDNIPYVIFLPKYSISGENYFQRRRELLNIILKTAAGLGLTRTEDRIEDYGQHFYIVTKMEKGRDETWT